MKTYFYITFLVLWGIPGILSAQNILKSELNSFHAGDIIIKQQVEYKDPGRSGEDVLWDFSRLNVINDRYELTYSAFNDYIITGTEHSNNYYYGTVNDSLFSLGYDNPTTRLYGIQPELMLHFPVNYGDSVSKYFYAHGKHGNRLELDAFGKTITRADAHGMILLPSGDTLKQVIRIHTIKYLYEDTRPIGKEYYVKQKTPLHISPDSINQRFSTDSLCFVLETFRWYARGYRYPVFETIRSGETLVTAFFFPPEEQYFETEDEANIAERQRMMEEENTISPSNNPWEGMTYNIFPNPVVSDLQFELFLPHSCNNVRIQIRSQMGLVYMDETKGAYPQGINHFSFNVNHLSTGNYVLDFWLDGYLIHGSVIMKR